MRIGGKRVAVAVLTGTAGAGLLTGGGSAWVMPAIVLTGLALIGGVVLPAVWFGQADRRRDARLVLQQLLDHARPK
jgi:Flp pilus assembly protein TadB